MTINVSKDVERSINAAVQSGRFLSADDAVTAAWNAFIREQPQGESVVPQPDMANAEASQQAKPIWERIQDLTADVPDEEWDKLPTDLAEQHDHYLYGTPKRQPR
jgi:Arc/MetJ-type ribon-helix-helix transcriptional regulator